MNKKLLQVPKRNIATNLKKKNCYKSQKEILQISERNIATSPCDKDGLRCWMCVTMNSCPEFVSEISWRGQSSYGIQVVAMRPGVVGWCDGPG